MSTVLITSWQDVLEVAIVTAGVVLGLWIGSRRR